jgi:3-methyladenine DNA glycosylase AlkD
MTETTSSKARLKSSNKVTAGQLKRELQKHTDPEKAAILSRFFKTGPGEYGESDLFWGIAVPVQRRAAAKFRSLPQEQIHRLLEDPVHECRLTALLILVWQYGKADGRGKQEIFDFYLRHIGGVNNWDLVDSSAPNIIGTHLLGRDKALLFKLAESQVVWERRIAVLASFTFIQKGDYVPTLRLAELLLHDDHVLIHKALGWMLREIGKRDRDVAESFLQVHASAMPRTMLRYAIERFDEPTRLRYLRGGARRYHR